MSQEKKKVMSGAGKVCLLFLKCQCPLTTKSSPRLVKVNVTKSYGHHQIHQMHLKSLLGGGDFFVFIKQTVCIAVRGFQLTPARRSFLTWNGWCMRCFHSQAVLKIGRMWCLNFKAASSQCIHLSQLAHMNPQEYTAVCAKEVHPLCSTVEETYLKSHIS